MLRRSAMMGFKLNSGGTNVERYISFRYRSEGGSVVLEVEYIQSRPR